MFKYIFPERMQIKIFDNCKWTFYSKKNLHSD